MSSYLKPQSPLYHKEEDAYFYPLTTADQVIMGNGSRLVEDIESFVNTKINEKVIYHKSRNLLPILNSSKTINGVTFTVNPDRSITMNGTATNEFAVFEFFGHSYYAYKPTFHKGSKLIASYEDNNCHFVAMRADGTIIQGRNNINIALANSECTFVMLGYGIVKGTTINNITIYPMILAPGDTDETYEPYYNGLANIDESPVMSMELLWENPSPNSEMQEGTAIDFPSGYDLYMINATMQYKRLCPAVFFLYGKGVVFSGIWGDEEQYMHRSLDATSTGFIVKNAYYNKNIRNDVMIPYEIYGFKGVTK